LCPRERDTAQSMSSAVADDAAGANKLADVELGDGGEKILGQTDSLSSLATGAGYTLEVRDVSYAVKTKEGKVCATRICVRTKPFLVC
jgi:hypothetical protein